MLNLEADRVRVIRPGQTYLGKQGFTYGAGASTETVGIKHICMNVLPISVGRLEKLTTVGASRQSRTFLKANARSTTGTNWNVE